MIVLKHCDVIFTVFKRDVNARTYFENPFNNFLFNVDGKIYSREQITTFNDERFIYENLDALNIKNSLLSSICKDLRTSLQPFTNYIESNNADSKIESKIT